MDSDHQSNLNSTCFTVVSAASEHELETELYVKTGIRTGCYGGRVAQDSVRVLPRKC